MLETMPALQMELKEKEAEVERLDNTCKILNNKIILSDDIRNSVEILQRRLEDSENVRQRQVEEIESQANTIQSL